MNPDYKAKADSLIRDARELWDGLEVLKEKQEEIKEEVENTNKMLEKKNVKAEEILKIIESFDDEKFKKLKKPNKKYIIKNIIFSIVFSFLIYCHLQFQF